MFLKTTYCDWCRLLNLKTPIHLLIEDPRNFLIKRNRTIVFSYNTNKEKEINLLFICITFQFKIGYFLVFFHTM